MSSPALELLEQMIVEAAAHIVSIEELDEERDVVDPERALFDLANERDNILLSLLNYVKEYGPAMDAMVRKEKAMRYIESPYIKEHEYMKAIRGE